MSNIRHLLHRRLQQKKLDKVVTGTLVIKQLNRLLGRDDITGSVKNHIIFVQTYDQALRIEIFQRQTMLLAELNQYLRGQGFRSRLDRIICR